MGRLKGKVAIITGAGQGLGLKIAEVFAREGAKVVGTGRTLSKVENSFAELKKENDFDLLALHHDVADRTSWEEVVEKTVLEFGKLDIVVNNAGIMAHKNVMDVSGEDFINVYKTNCLAIVYSVQTCVPEMDKAGGGSFVNIDSIGGIVSGDADGGDAAYSASKGGTRSLTKHIAYQLADKKIRANTVHPGGLLTPMLKGVFDANPEMWERIKKTSPLPPHISEPEDLAQGVLYLASDESRTVTGTELVIDCGYMMH